MNRRRSDKINQQETAQRRYASELVRRKKAHLLVDGYNLMHVSRFKPTGNSAGELRRCREGLLSLLAAELSPQQYREITIVFDSENAPGHLPDQAKWKHVHVQFARKENSADDLVVSLIRQHASPKQLIVVSSDHRIHVAAGKRVAIVDSDLWLDALLENSSTRSKASDQEPAAQAAKTPMSAKDLEEFRKAMAEEQEMDGEASIWVSSTEGHSQTNDQDIESGDDANIEFENPFPKDYLEGLEDEFG